MGQIEELENFLKTNVPMIDYSNLSIEFLDNQKCVIKMPFSQQNKNHVNSLYFGSILIGTEVAAGILAMYQIKQSDLKINLVFKDVAGNFLKRSEKDTYFICTDHKIISEAITEATITQKRVNKTVSVIGVTDLDNLEDKVSEFKITISIKQQSH